MPDKANVHKKTYVLDTNVIINSAQSIFSFGENIVVLADVTLDELDNLKSRPGELGYAAREANRQLFQLKEDAKPTESIRSGISLENGGTFRVETNFINVELPAHWDPEKPDHRILRVAKGLAEKEGKKNVTLITSDTAMLLKAEIIGVTASRYDLSRLLPSTDKGQDRKELYCAKEEIAHLFEKNKDASIPADIFPESFYENEYVTVIDQENPSHSALGRYERGRIVPLLAYHPYGVNPRNAGQKFAIDAMMQPVSKIPLVILKGSAGTAKTFLSMACGLESVVEESLFHKIFVTRANVKFDEDIGFLKGTEIEKIMPLMRPIRDNLELLSNLDDKKPGTSKNCEDKDMSFRIDEYFENGTIVTEALAYLRGRSIAKTFILIDEAQNLTPSQALGIITRAGVGSKIVMAGDPGQIDNPRLDARNNGLTFASTSMRSSALCAEVSFIASECERSILSMEAAEKMKL